MIPRYLTPVSGICSEVGNVLTLARLKDRNYVKRSRDIGDEAGDGLLELTVTQSRLKGKLRAENPNVR